MSQLKYEILMLFCLFNKPEILFSVPTACSCEACVIPVQADEVNTVSVRRLFGLLRIDNLCRPWCLYIMIALNAFVNIRCVKFDFLNPVSF